LQNIQDIQPKQRLKKYEAMFLLDNREVKKGWEYAKGIPLSILERHGAKIVSARRWDERKLAYEIKKQKRATFLLVFFEALPEKITPINREVQLTEGILRHLILVHDEFPPMAFEPVDDDVDVSKIPLGDEEEAAEEASTEEEAPKAAEEGEAQEPSKEDGEARASAGEGAPAAEETGEKEKKESDGSAPAGEGAGEGEEETKPQEG